MKIINPNGRMSRLWHSHARLLAALRSIAAPVSPYNINPLQHAQNTVATMQDEARAAIARDAVDPDDPATIDATAAAILDSGDLEGGA